MHKALQFLCVLTLLVNVQNSFAKDWGHLVTGTTDTLNQSQTTIGTHLLAFGATDRITIGVVPLTYLGYQMHGVGTRINILKSEAYNLASDVFYFDSLDAESSSPFEQTSWSYKLNNKIRFAQNFSLYITLGYQYFINDESPFSLRPDPQGRFITFASKTRSEYELKQASFTNDPRDPSTTSITLMPSIRTGRHSFINLEYGIVGTNYDYPLRHVGMSINFEQDRSDWSLGLSKTSRSTPFIGRENIFHLETKFQFYI